LIQNTFEVQGTRINFSKIEGLSSHRFPLCENPYGNGLLSYILMEYSRARAHFIQLDDVVEISWWHVLVSLTK
jgi:hypothetical protein